MAGERLQRSTHQAPRPLGAERSHHVPHHQPHCLAVQHRPSEGPGVHVGRRLDPLHRAAHSRHREGGRPRWSPSRRHPACTSSSPSRSPRSCREVVPPLDGPPPLTSKQDQDRAGPEERSSGSSRSVDVAEVDDLSNRQAEHVGDLVEEAHARQEPLGAAGVGSASRAIPDRRPASEPEEAGRPWVPVPIGTRDEAVAETMDSTALARCTHSGSAIQVVRGSTCNSTNSSRDAPRGDRQVE